MIQEIAPKKYHVEYIPGQKPSGSSVLMICDREGVLVKKEGEAGRLPLFSDFTAAGADPETLKAEARYLFAIDDERYFLLPRAAVPEALFSGGFRFLPPSEFRSFRPKYMAFAAVTASQIRRFYVTRQFCGRCGNSMKHSETERAMVCPHCGLTEYPKISPAIIVAVRDTSRERILLTRYQRNASDYRKKALVAGFVEVGETPEETVEREVFEETGLHVKNIRPYKIQPWSFSDSMMLAYTAELDGSDRVTLQESELCEAQFYTRAEVPENPDMTSVGNEMIQAFRRGLL